MLKEKIKAKRISIPGLNGSLIIFDKVAPFPSKAPKIILLF
jgi:hypothetical protein